MQQVLAFGSGILAYLILYFLAQLAVFNIHRVKQLIITFTILSFATGFLVWGAFYFLTADFFPDPITRALLAFGGLYGSCGFSGTYIILGPISADRSLSAHTCIQFLRNGGRMNEQDLLRKYNQSVIFGKRFEEYLEVGVMKREGQDLVLTGKGRRVAHIFGFFLKALNMKENF